MPGQDYDPGDAHRAPPNVNRGLRYRSFGVPAQTLALDVLPFDALGTGQIRVRMIMAPVNPSDLIPITGAYGHRIVLPCVAGYEGVGRVVETDGKTRHLLGRRVLPLRGQGTWQQFVVCDAAKAIAVPDSVPDHLAARAYINPLAARLMLQTWNVRGRNVLLTAAGSACAGLLAQWALRRGASNVFGITDSADHDVRLLDLGVQPLRSGDRDAIAAAARHCDCVFDAVGGPLAERLLNACAPHSVFVSYGALSGSPARGQESRIKPQRFHIRDRLAGVRDDTWQSWFAALWPLLEETRMPGVSAFPVATWADALAAFSRRGRERKPVLTFG